MSAQPDERFTGAVTALEDPPLLTPAQPRFHDRHDAGRALAPLLERFRGEKPVVVAMPRGGVPVAAEVARALEAPLDVALVRKIGAPRNAEFAIGALAEGGVQVLSGHTVRALALTRGELQALLARAEAELAEQSSRYRGSRPPVDLVGRTAILVDDGLATGRSALAAIRSLRQRGAARVILAVPVAAPQAAEALAEEADEVVSVEMPEELWAVGYWYEDFRPTSDAEVTSLLAESGRTDRRAPAPATAGSPTSHDPRTQPAEAGTAQGVAITAGPLVLAGDLSMPASARGVVVFAHGSGSSRLSPRNQSVATALLDAGYATLLFDLLTPVEELDRANVFDIPLLASRLIAASTWVSEHHVLAALPLAYFGASTGAAAALTAAAELGDRVGAVISRGGRPDLALHLDAVRAPTLLIVGGADPQVLDLNRAAQRQLRCPNELLVVPGATHLFEEPGALEQVSSLAIEWLGRHLPQSTPLQTHPAH
ncbi:MAG: phosphoribosyltransferase family protein [Solirubrobacteraceae bacterium]